MFIARQSAAADYRRQAQQTREVAVWISIRETRRQLLATAAHLEALAEDEERRAQEARPSDGDKHR